MSALITVVKSDRVEILSDTAAADMRDGTVTHFVSKQVILPNVGVICPMSSLFMGNLFAVYAAMRCSSFDELIAAADGLWREAREVVPEDELRAAGFQFWGVAFAGWSEAEQDFDTLFIDNADHRAATPHDAFAMGATPDAIPVIGAFLENLADDLEAFDAHADGIALIEELRRLPVQFREARHPMIGGEIEHTTITDDGIRTQTIYRWPDVVGEPIDPEREGTADTTGQPREPHISLREIGEHIDGAALCMTEGA